MSSLIELLSGTRELEIKLQACLDNGLPITDELELQVEEMLSKEAQKVDGFCNFLSYLKNKIEFGTDQLMKAETWLDKEQKKLDWLKRRAVSTMTGFGLKRLEGTLGRYMRISASTRVDIHIDLKPEDLPKEYVREKTVTTLSFDKDKIHAALEAGVEIPGCRLIQNHGLIWK